MGLKVFARVRVEALAGLAQIGQPEADEAFLADRSAMMRAAAQWAVRRAGLTAAHGGGIWELPGPTAWTDALCDKLAANPTEAQWKEWVSDDPDIGYRKKCPNKP